MTLYHKNKSFFVFAEDSVGEAENVGDDVQYRYTLSDSLWIVNIGKEKKETLCARCRSAARSPHGRRIVYLSPAFCAGLSMLSLKRTQSKP
jgi:hypothetical protein